jgi:hypothetical protein
MTVDQVLADLRRCFGHKFVLSAADIAVVLNQSETALEDLISRRELPFQVEMMGGYRCVAIYPVAEWLAKSGAAPELTESQESRAEASVRSSSSGKPKRRSSVPATDHSKIAERILQMRQANASQLGTLVSTYTDHDIQRLFLLDVMERMVFVTGLPPSRFVLALSSIDPSVAKEVVSETKWLFENGEAALERTRELWRGRFDNPTFRLVLRQGRRVLFRGHVISGLSAVLIDLVDCIETDRDC